MNSFIIPFSEITLKDLPEVGGKNASLGEMINKLQPMGINVPDGFAITVEGYWQFLAHNNLIENLKALLHTIDCSSLSNLPRIGLLCRNLLSNADLPDKLKNEIKVAYRKLSGENKNVSVAVRSSATAEDLPTASFAGQHDSFLNIYGEENLLNAVHKCYVSLFNDRAIAYRIDNGFDHMWVGLSVGIQFMVRADEGCAGVIFTLDPESGFKNAIYITGSWGLGDNVVQGAVNPDEYWVFKPTLLLGKNAIVSRKKGTKDHTLVYDENRINGLPVKNVETPTHKRTSWILSDREVSQLAGWSLAIENHYRSAMNIEWAKDGLTNKIYIVQARPETVHSQKQHGTINTYKLKEKGKIICKGKAVGKKIISGRACIIHSLHDAQKLQKGDILVADITNPDWNSLLRKVASIITNKGGRTSHAAIVARELGIAAIVGTCNATQVIKDGDLITVANTEGEEGLVLEGKVNYEVSTTDLSRVPAIDTTALLILADPDQAFECSFFPAKGVGLLRMECILANSLFIHPMALVRFDNIPDIRVKNTIEQMTAGYKNKSTYFVDQLSEAIAKVAAAFYPGEVIVRMSDFKTNEYASLIGGQFFEPVEENPLIGFRDASRYYDNCYLPRFGLECDAVLKVRNDMGFTNVKVMIPFCQTIKEAKKVLQTMEILGLKRGQNKLEIYMMIEISSNVILADQFAALFDGFSIGTNNLTQLSFGLDKDSEIVSHLFDEKTEAVKSMITQVINSAKKAGIKIGMCGQAPGDFPEFSQFLVRQGIDSISFTQDALVKGIENIARAEKKFHLTTQSQTHENYHL